MKFSLAPMEGITGHVTRMAFHHHFDYIDKYYTPFISYAIHLNRKQIAELLPENNTGMTLIPQVMANKADDVIYMHKLFQNYGYDSLNINLGCPSNPVVRRNCGAGFLLYPEQLERFLDELFDKADFPIGIKTRIGFSSEDEWEELLEIYEKYPLTELIVHPRVREDFYRNTVRLNAFAKAYRTYQADNQPLASSEASEVNVNIPHISQLWYNGDISDRASFFAVSSRFPKLDGVMIGRGLYRNPGAILQIKGIKISEQEYRRRLIGWHDEIFTRYQEIYAEKPDSFFKMKEIWAYLRHSFEDTDRQMHAIRQSRNPKEFKDAADSILYNNALTFV